MLYHCCATKAAMMRKDKRYRQVDEPSDDNGSTLETRIWLDFICKKMIHLKKEEPSELCITAFSTLPKRKNDTVTVTLLRMLRPTQDVTKSREDMQGQFVTDVSNMHTALSELVILLEPFQNLAFDSFLNAVLARDLFPAPNTQREQLMKDPNARFDPGLSRRWNDERHWYVKNTIEKLKVNGSQIQYYLELIASALSAIGTDKTSGNLSIIAKGIAQLIRWLQSIRFNGTELMN
jgi:hypothetical protein